MTHPIDAMRQKYQALLAESDCRELMVSRQTLTLLAQPDPRVTALVEAASAIVTSPHRGTVSALQDAIAPFLKDESDAN